MTVYLNKNFFKPAALVFSAVFSILLLLIVTSLIVRFHVITLIGLFVFLGIYGGVLGFFYYKSKSQKEYLKETNEYLEIHYPEVNYYKDDIRLPYNAITGFTYYSMTSWKGWENFIKTGALPGCMYIHYLTPRGKSVDALIGYWDKDFAQKFVSRYGLTLKIV